MFTLAVIDDRVVLIRCMWANPPTVCCSKA